MKISTKRFKQEISHAYKILASALEGFEQINIKGECIEVYKVLQLLHKVNRVAVFVDNPELALHPGAYNSLRPAFGKKKYTKEKLKYLRKTYKNREVL
jgi:hypothetical protein